MSQTAPRAPPNFLGQEFNKFLFAPVGTDRYGAQLSVISALARLDLDAWAEAAALARLPRDAAVIKLAAWLRRYPEIPQLTQDSAAIAARLLALLPGSIILKRASQAAPNRFGAVSGAAGLLMLITLAVLLGLQYASHATTHQSPPPQAASLPLDAAKQR